MAKIETLDSAITDVVKKKLKKFDQKIKEEVARQAKEQGHNIKTSNVKKIEFIKVDLEKQITDFKTGEMSLNNDELNVVVYSMIYDNNSDTTDQASFEYHETRLDSWHWQISAGVTFEYKTEAQVPALAKVSKSVKVDFSASYGEAHEQSKKWDWAATPNIPPRSKTVMHAIIKQIAGDVPFSCTLIADGKIWCRAHIDYWGKHTRQFDIPLTRLLDIKERTYTTTGVIKGASGLQAVVDKEQKPLTDKEQKELKPGLTQHKLGSISLKKLALKV